MANVPGRMRLGEQDRGNAASDLMDIMPATLEEEMQRKRMNDKSKQYDEDTKAVPGDAAKALDVPYGTDRKTGEKKAYTKLLDRIT